ncbi:MAG: ribonuclease P protein component [Deltaproteobacteria bacterium]|nr:ribonuclease P protein component [Deltaproteobacteria bacterium]
MRFLEKIVKKPAYLCFSRQNRLRKRSEFERASRGNTTRKVFLGRFLIFPLANKLGYNRLGVIVTKKVGKAVFRNKIKREAREFFRQQTFFWPQGLDLIFIARRQGCYQKLSDLRDSPAEFYLKQALKQALNDAKS